MLTFGTWAFATFLALVLSHVRSRRTSPSPQNVASKYVLGGTPDPVLLSVQVAGSSAPLSVETTSTRCTLIAHHSSLNGAVARSELTKVSTSVANLGSSDAR